MRRTRLVFATDDGSWRMPRAIPFAILALLLALPACGDAFDFLTSVRLTSEHNTTPEAQARRGANSRQPAGGERSATIATIAFGSCNDAFADQPLWTYINAAEPDVFLWTGDIVYADVANLPPVPGRVRLRFGLPRVATESDLRGHYALQKNLAGYAELRRRTRVLGIYDDHDYGQNDAGRNFRLREAAQSALLDFLDEPANSPRRSRAGAYAAYDYATPGGPLRIVLLDTRYHRDEPGPQSDVLGPEQWRWLERQLTNSPARWHWLVSSIQILPEEHPYESWARFPAARERLLRLLEDTRPRGLVLVSGDRHLAEISRMRLPEGFELREITSSGMTHSVPENWQETNRHRVGELFAGLNFGLATFDSQRTMTLEIRGADGRIARSIQFKSEP